MNNLTLLHYKRKRVLPHVLDELKNLTKILVILEDKDIETINSKRL